MLSGKIPAVGTIAGGRRGSGVVLLRFCLSLTVRAPCIYAPVAGESGVALWKGRFDLPTQLRFLHNTDPDLIFSDIACRARI